MKKRLVIFFVAVLVLGFGYAAYAIHETPVSGTKSVIPGADAAGLYNYITNPKPYTDTMKPWPGKEERSPAKEPHGAFAKTYVNSPALKAIKSKAKMPDGAVIIHEEYNAKNNLVALSVMYKMKGFNSEAGDWFCAKYDALNGYVLESGKSASCIACHDSKEATDYLFSVE